MLDLRQETGIYLQFPELLKVFIQLLGAWPNFSSIWAEMCCIMIQTLIM